MNGESRIGGISEGVSGVNSVGRLAGVSEPRAREVHGPVQGQVSRGEDKVELSTEAQVLAPWLEKLKQIPAVRQDLIDQIRTQIASGSYDTPEKLNAALDGMIDETQSGQIC